MTVMTVMTELTTHRTCAWEPFLDDLQVLRAKQVMEKTGEPSQALDWCNGIVQIGRDYLRELHESRRQCSVKYLAWRYQENDWCSSTCGPVGVLRCSMVFLGDPIITTKFLLFSFFFFFGAERESCRKFLKVGCDVFFKITQPVEKPTYSATSGLLHLDVLEIPSETRKCVPENIQIQAWKGFII